MLGATNPESGPLQTGPELECKRSAEEDHFSSGPGLTVLTPPPEPPPPHNHDSCSPGAVPAQICKHQKARTEPEPEAKRGVRVTSRTRLQTQEPRQDGSSSGNPFLNLSAIGAARPAESPPPVPLAPPEERCSPTPTQSALTTLSSTKQPRHFNQPSPTRTSTPPWRRDIRRGRGRSWRRGGGEVPVGVGGNKGENSGVGSEAALSFPTQKDAFVLEDRK